MRLKLPFVFEEDLADLTDTNPKTVVAKPPPGFPGLKIKLVPTLTGNWITHLLTNFGNGYGENPQIESLFHRTLEIHPPYSGKVPIGNIGQTRRFIGDPTFIDILAWHESAEYLLANIYIVGIAPQPNRQVYIWTYLKNSPQDFEVSFMRRVKNRIKFAKII